MTGIGNSVKIQVDPTEGIQKLHRSTFRVLTLRMPLYLLGFHAIWPSKINLASKIGKVLAWPLSLTLSLFNFVEAAIAMVHNFVTGYAYRKQYPAKSVSIKRQTCVQQ